MTRSEATQPMPMSAAEIADLVRRVHAIEDDPAHRGGKARRLAKARRAKHASRIKRWRYRRVAKP